MRDRHREKLIQDRLQLLLNRMLQEEDNKYCVDCDSKGPRWVSWNLGIFLCIKCAGIHRNLGVHISKVKSVNLDTWTPQQVASMQVMGNSKARAIYEAGVPDDHRRPQADSALEQFIRNKYEKKKFIAREWRPTPPPDLPIGWAEIIEAEKQKRDIRSVKLPSISAPHTTPEHLATTATSTTAPTNLSNSPGVSNKTSPVPARQTPAINQTIAVPALAVTAPAAKSGGASVDLLGLTTNPAPVTTSQMTSDFDLLGLGGGARPATAPASKPTPVVENDNDFDDFVGVSSSGTTQQQQQPSSSDLFADFSNSSVSNGGGAQASQMSKDSIMALFNKPPQGAPPASVTAGTANAGFGGPTPSSNMMGMAGGGPGGVNPNNQMAINQQLNQLGLNRGGGQFTQAAPTMVQPNNLFNMTNNSDLSNLGSLNGLAGLGNNIGSTQPNKQSWGFH